MASGDVMWHWPHGSLWHRSMVLQADSSQTLRHGVGRVRGNFIQEFVKCRVEIGSQSTEVDDKAEQKLDNKANCRESYHGCSW